MSLLSGLWSLTRSHRQFVVNFLLPIGLAVLACSSLAAWNSEHDARVKNDAEHERYVRLADANIASISRAYLRASDSLKVVGDGVTTSRVEYKTLRDTVLLEFERAPSAVRALLPHLPTFIQKADDTVNWCTEFQLAAAKYQFESDSLVGAVREKADSLEHWGVWKPPRFSGQVDILYDPIAKAPATSAGIALRVHGNWSAIARGDYRATPGEAPVLYVGVRRSF